MKSISASRTIYLKILASIIIFIVLVIITLSAVLYLNFDRVAVSLIHTFIKDSLLQVSYSASFMTQSVKTLSAQIYFNPDVAKLYNFSTPDPKEAGDGTNALHIYHTTVPYIHSIYVYNGRQQMIYSDISSVSAKSSESFFDKDIVAILKAFKNYPKLTPIPRRIPNPIWNEKDHGFSNVYSFIFYELTGNKQQLPGAVVLNISESYMQDIIKSLDLNKESYTYIVDKNGIMASSSKQNLMLDDVSALSHIKSVLDAREESGYFIEEVDGVKSLITYVTSPNIGWRFIQVTPYKMITQKMNTIRYISLVVVILILLCCLIMTRFISRSLHKPIDGILTELKALEHQQRDNYLTVKNKLFMDIFNGGIEFDAQVIKSRLTELKIGLDPESPLTLVMIRIDNFVDFCSKYNYDDRCLMKFGIINIASELCSNYAANEAVDAGEDYIVVVINLPENNENEFRLLLNKIQQSVFDYLKLSVTIVVSTSGSSVSDLGILYSTLLDAGRYRIIYGHKSIIYSDEITKSITAGYVFPVQKEKHLTDAVMLEKMEEAKAVYNEIVQEAKAYSCSTLNLVLMRLAFTVNTALEGITANAHFSFSHDLNSFTSSLNRAETLDEINDLFIKLFDLFTVKLEEKKDAKYDQLVEKIIGIISDSYVDPNLSVYTISDCVSMSPVYLGRLFKKLTSRSVADYINDVRMEHAKKLLLTTDKSVKEIVDETGYSNTSYFFTLFKKMHGTTPNDFRQNLPNSTTNM